MEPEPIKEEVGSHYFNFQTISLLFLIFAFGFASWTVMFFSEKQTVINSRLATNTIRGVDLDNNGIRDDIDKYIVDTYTSQNLINSLNQYAVAIQKVVVNYNNSSKSGEAYSELIDAGKCFYDISKDGNEIIY